MADLSQPFSCGPAKRNIHTHTHTHTHIYIYIYAHTCIHTHTDTWTRRTNFELKQKSWMV